MKTSLNSPNKEGRNFETSLLQYFPRSVLHPIILFLLPKLGPKHLKPQHSILNQYERRGHNPVLNTGRQSNIVHCKGTTYLTPTGITFI